MEKKVTDLTMLKLSYFKNIKTFQKIQNKKKRIYLIDLNNLRYSGSMGCALSSALKYNGVNKKGYQTKIADGL